MERSQRTRTVRGSRSDDRSNIYSVSSPKSLTSYDDSVSAEERRIDYAEKRMNRLKEQIEKQQVSQQTVRPAPPTTTMKERLKSVFTRKSRATIQPILEEPQTAKRKHTIKDKDCGSIRDFISHDRIPKKYALYIDKQCYDARSLLQWLDQSRERKLPHTNVPVTVEQYQKVYMKVNPPLESAIEIIDPSEYTFRMNNSMIRATVSNDGTRVAFYNNHREIEVWNMLTKSKVATLDVQEGDIYWMSWSKADTELQVLIRYLGVKYVTQLKVEYRVWNTRTWQKVPTEATRLFTATNPKDVHRKYTITYTTDGRELLGILVSNVSNRTNGYEIYDMNTLERVTYGFTSSYHNIIHSMAPSPDGTRTAIDFGHKVQIINNASKEVIAEFNTRSVQSISWNCDGTKLAIQDVLFSSQNRRGSTIVTIIDVPTNRKLTEHSMQLYSTLLWHPTNERCMALLQSDRKEMVDVMTINSRSIKIKRIIAGAISTTTWSNQLQWIKNGDELVLNQQNRIYRWGMTGIVSGGSKKGRKPQTHKK